MAMPRNIETWGRSALSRNVWARAYHHSWQSPGVLLSPRVEFNSHRSGIVYGSPPNNGESHIWVASSRSSESIQPSEWTLDISNAMRSGWLNKDPEWKPYVLEDGDKIFIHYGLGLEYIEDESLTEPV